MKTKTLRQVCQLLEKYKLYDFSTPLQVHYREPEPDGQNGYLGSCVVEKDNDEYKELFIDDKERDLYHDGDYYGLDVDEIFMWDFRGERGVHNPILTVYVIAEWSDKVMTNREALQIISENLAVAIHDVDGINPEYEYEQVTALDMAYDAIEKRIPKKPAVKHVKGNALVPEHNKNICPCCSTVFDIQEEPSYCKDCGQAIDWSDK